MSDRIATARADDEQREDDALPLRGRPRFTVSVAAPCRSSGAAQDSASGEALRHEAFTRGRGRWLDGFHPQGERWLVWADEHRPASLDPTTPPATDETLARTTVLLERGWSQLRRYQRPEVEPALDTARKWSRPPLSGVQVRADGLSVERRGRHRDREPRARPSASTSGSRRGARARSIRGGA